MKSLLIIFIGAILVLFTGLGKGENKSRPLAFGILSLALVGVLLDIFGKMNWHWEATFIVRSMVYFEFWSLCFSGVLIIATMLVIGLFGEKNFKGADLLGLLLFSLCGGMLMTGFNNMVMLFIGLEALSIPLFVLAGSRKTDLRGNEAAVKYFLMGAFSTAIFLMGTAFVYGGTGTMDLNSMRYIIGTMAHNGFVSSYVNVGILLLLCGLAFKIAAVPFHFWSPDVYEGSPNRITLFMSTVVKISAFAAFFRLFSNIFDFVLPMWGLVFATIAAATILVGNIAALRQNSVKRTLAYSSIAHAGYMIMGILSRPEEGFWALLIYSLGYVAASVIVFYIFNRVSENGDETFEAFSGLAEKNKFLSVLLAISMFSMAGIPLTAGFSGKYSLFASAFTGYSWLVVIALVGSAISIAYYFRIFKYVFFTSSTGESTTYTLGNIDKVLLVLALLIILALGIAPGMITGFQYV